MSGLTPIEGGRLSYKVCLCRFGCIALMCYALIFYRWLAAEELKFVNQDSGFVVVEQRDDKIIFHDPILQAEMIEIGVAIPPQDQARYGFCEYVKFGEIGFFDAFQEFYSIYIYDPAIYQWKQ